MSPPDRLATVSYVDSSALVKRYFAETGTAWMLALCDAKHQNIAVAEIGLVEIAGALAGKRRGGFITEDEYQSLRADLAIDAREGYFLVSASRAIVDAAIELTARHRLRGYDAVHLACALHLNRALARSKLAPLTLISADEDLLKAASAESLVIDNPNEHP